jgi:endonuclease/exonuclease/phosphatase family metal-dependent hydrolase
MKNYMWRLILTFYGILLLLSSSVQAQQNAAQKLTIMSFNVRYNTPKDSLYPWQNRKGKVAEVIASNKADIAGLQEPWFDQITDLEKLLPDYAWIGWSRDDGKTKGEFTPVFYLKDKFDVLEKGVFWLSSTPENPGSIGWDEKLPRTVIRILFSEKSTGKQFWFFNTHLGGNIARTEGAKLLKTRIDEIAGDLPVIVTGDFNSKPESEPVQIMLDKNYRIVLEDGFNKALKKNDEIYTDYWFDGENKDLKRIDYIFVNQKVKVLYHEIINKRMGRYYPSDHLAIKAVIEISN